MAHLHEMRDSDNHFIIDPTTMVITNNSAKHTLQQGDHNCEIYSFEIPRVIEGHDMTLCNLVQIHYINIKADKTEQSKDVHTVTDMAVSDTEADTLVFTWTVHGNATKYAGSLNFRIHFNCIDADGNYTYRKHTEIFKGITISEGFDNAEAVAVDNSDVLAEWEARLNALEAYHPESPDYASYFDIDYDGVISLKAEYQADGSKNAELPEIIVIPDVIDGTAVSGFVAGMFQNNLRVKEITIPDGVTQLPDQFCSGAKNLIALHNTGQITKLGQRIVLNTQIRKAMFPNLKEAAVGALAQAFFMHTADIGNNITEIPYGLFRNCSLLSLVKGGGNVTTIGKEAFFYNRNLKNLPFLSQVTSIGAKAFYQSRIQFDWSTIESQCTFANGAVPVMDNTTDYWTGVNHTPCENPLVTMMSQVNPEWADSFFGDSVQTYRKECAVFTVLHLHSALSGKRYNHPDEFAEELRAIDPTLVTQDKHPTNFSNVVPMLNALGYNSENGYTVTVVTDAITQESYQALCDALARGAYVYAQASGYDSSGVVTPDYGHAVVLYGINSNNEMLVLDSATLHYAYAAVGVDDIFTYRMPIQNLTGPSSNFIIVEKNA